MNLWTATSFIRITIWHIHTKRNTKSRICIYFSVLIPETLCSTPSLGTRMYATMVIIQIRFGYNLNGATTITEWIAYQRKSLLIGIHKTKWRSEFTNPISSYFLTAKLTTGTNLLIGRETSNFIWGQLCNRVWFSSCTRRQSLTNFTELIVRNTPTWNLQKQVVIITLKKVLHLNLNSK